MLIDGFNENRKISLSTSSGGTTITARGPWRAMNIRAVEQIAKRAISLEHILQYSRFSGGWLQPESRSGQYSCLRLVMRKRSSSRIQHFLLSMIGDRFPQENISLFFHSYITSPSIIRSRCEAKNPFQLVHRRKSLNYEKRARFYCLFLMLQNVITLQGYERRCIVNGVSRTSNNFYANNNYVSRLWQILNNRALIINYVQPFTDNCITVSILLSDGSERAWEWENVALSISTPLARVTSTLDRRIKWFTSERMTSNMNWVERVSHYEPYFLRKIFS